MMQYLCVSTDMLSADSVTVKCCNRSTDNVCYSWTSERHNITNYPNSWFLEISRRSAKSLAFFTWQKEGKSMSTCVLHSPRSYFQGRLSRINGEKHPVHVRLMSTHEWGLKLVWKHLFAAYMSTGWFCATRRNMSELLFCSANVENTSNITNNIRVFFLHFQ